MLARVKWNVPCVTHVIISTHKQTNRNWEVAQECAKQSQMYECVKWAEKSWDKMKSEIHFFFCFFLRPFFCFFSATMRRPEKKKRFCDTNSMDFYLSPWTETREWYSWFFDSLLMQSAICDPQSVSLRPVSLVSSRILFFSLLFFSFSLPCLGASRVFHSRHKRPVNCVTHTHRQTYTVCRGVRAKWIYFLFVSVNMRQFFTFPLSHCNPSHQSLVSCQVKHTHTHSKLSSNLFTPPLLALSSRAFDCLANLQVSLSLNSLSLLCLFFFCPLHMHFCLAICFLSIYSLSCLSCCCCSFFSLSLRLSPPLSIIFARNEGPWIANKQRPLSCLPLEQFNQWK